MFLIFSLGLRVYGALMWSLGKVVQTPEVMRVYMGSFWDQPLKNKELEKLFAAEQVDNNKFLIKITNRKLKFDDRFLTFL